MNRGIGMSLQIEEEIGKDLVGPLEEMIVKKEVKIDGKGFRRRLYTPDNTYLTMLVTATQEDRTLQNSVVIFKRVAERRMGVTGISLNTASYTEARKRLPLACVQKAYYELINTETYKENKWFGKTACITDGTCIQLSDTPELRKRYPGQVSSFQNPLAMLQGVIHQGSGQVVDFEIGNRQTSELALCSKILKRLPKESVLLADDLYNSYCLFAQARSEGIDVIVPAKRTRSYRVVKTYSDADELIEINLNSKSTQKPWALPGAPYPKTLLLRKLTYTDPVTSISRSIITTLLDPKISACDIVLKYTSRWDIELAIRELKTIMGMALVRAKSEEMIFKEITVSFTSYNLLRQIIQKASKPSFPPSDEDLFQKYYSFIRPRVTDSLGRRPSPGRPKTPRSN